MRFDPNLDAYRELGVPPDASMEAIRQAYLALARRYHPDRAPVGRAAEYEERMKRINQAYELLKNPDTRQLYDRLRAPAAVKGSLRHSATAAAPCAQRNDPYVHMRAGYQQRLHRVQLSTLGLPPWARALAGVCAGLGLVVGFLLGLPFGIIGSIPGAMVGTVIGMVVGLFAVYLCALGLPTAILALVGWWLGQTVGALVGALLGLGLGGWWVVRLWRRMRRHVRLHAEPRASRGFSVRV